MFDETSGEKKKCKPFPLSEEVPRTAADPIPKNAGVHGMASAAAVAAVGKGRVGVRKSLTSTAIPSSAL